MARVSPELDKACAEAVDVARAAAERRSGVFGVGDHQGVKPEDIRVATHYFACDHKGYPGWQWSVTVARASRARTVTVSEVLMVPGDGALLAPSWVPWAARIAPKDLTPGVISPPDADDVRLVPGYTAADVGASSDPVNQKQVREVVAQLGLRRSRLLSLEGQARAAQRWQESDSGPNNQMTHQAPALCEACGFMVSLTGRLGRVFGVCSNEFSPQDGQVVSRDHGCGGHSDAPTSRRGIKLGVPVWDTISVEPALFT